MDYLKKTIFATIWDYEQAGVLNPAIDRDILLLTNFFNESDVKIINNLDIKNLSILNEIADYKFFNLDFISFRLKNKIGIEKAYKITKNSGNL